MTRIERSRDALWLWLTAVGLCIGIALLARYAGAVDVCNKALCSWAWTDPEGAAKYEVEIERDAMPTYYYTTTRNWVTLSPADHAAVRKMRLRVRRLPDDGKGWSEWSEFAYGVPVGFFPDWDRDGVVTPTDLTLGGRAQSEGWRWPLR